MRAAVVSAFVKEHAGGNLAGVVLDAESIPEAKRKRIAADLGFSETAFVERSSTADFKLRFFTPVEEVPLCGHATIAAWAYLFRERRVKAGAFTQETKAGVLRIEIESRGGVMMDMPLPVFGKEVCALDCARVLNLPAPAVVGRPRVVATGIPDLLVAVSTKVALMAMKPNMSALQALCAEHGAAGIHAFVVDQTGAACRNFAPGLGIPEEPATGTASGALACHLFDRGLVSTREIVFSQGDSMGRPSRIVVQLGGARREIARVQVGGRARVEKLVEAG